MEMLLIKLLMELILVLLPMRQILVQPSNDFLNNAPTGASGETLTYGNNDTASGSAYSTD